LSYGKKLKDFVNRQLMIIITRIGGIEQLSTNNLQYDAIAHGIGIRYDCYTSNCQIW
jgi:hypothetical protein